MARGWIAVSELGCEDAPTGAAAEDDGATYDVAQILDRLASVVGDAFPEDVWVRGQIRNLSKSRKGHVYFDLATPAAADGSPDAALPVVLFDWFRKIVNRILGPDAAGHMTDGVEVRIRGPISIYAARGQLQLQMRAIDPSYTLSKLTDERRRLLAELKAAGLLERNRSLPLPTLPLRVALVTSANSAAAADFREVLARSGIGWELLVVDTPVQGFGSDQRIAAALAAACEQAADVIALVRGGGARTEMAPFDSAAVAHAVAQSAVPVLTGIGHEIDRSVADIVAKLACDTPTACATALVDRARRFDRATLDLWRNIERAGAHGFESARWQLDGQHDLLATRAGAHLARHRQMLGSAARRLRLNSSHTLETERRRLEALAAQTRAYDPQRTLERGWSITRDTAGRLIRSVREIAPGARLRTRLWDGTVTSTAVEAESTEGSWSDDD
ncbi:MAG: exodeoxyribonuclease VII large subunit [Acidimicrobiia bacterium]|nr:exodeoxyribonuclease VII large subunit [Acidimicrobiia bacterium]MYJ13493.1 exodeoxyribonuclease VII large subunit [Acidimicrobiia bacterium]